MPSSALNSVATMPSGVTDDATLTIVWAGVGAGVGAGGAGDGFGVGAGVGRTRRVRAKGQASGGAVAALHDAADEGPACCRLGVGLGVGAGVGAKSVVARLTRTRSTR